MALIPTFHCSGRGPQAALLRGLAALLVVGAAAGCGGIPDVKVEVAQMAPDTTQLAVVVWRAGDKKPAQAIPFFDVPPESAKTSFNFGLSIGGHDSAYIINVAEFSPNSQQRPCLRGTGTSAQAAGFPILSSITVLMPKPPLAAGTNCYDVMDDQQAKPLITNAIIVVNRSTDMTEPTVLLLVQGWNFLPSYPVKIQQVRTPLTGLPTTTDRSPPTSNISVESPTQIDMKFAKADLLWLEDPQSQLVITITYGSGKTVSSTFPSFSQ